MTSQPTTITRDSLGADGRLKRRYESEEAPVPRSGLLMTIGLALAGVFSSTKTASISRAVMVSDDDDKTAPKPAPEAEGPVVEAGPPPLEPNERPDAFEASLGGDDSTQSQMIGALAPSNVRALPPAANGVEIALPGDGDAPAVALKGGAQILRFAPASASRGRDANPEAVRVDARMDAFVLPESASETEARPSSEPVDPVDAGAPPEDEPDSGDDEGRENRRSSSVGVSPPLLAGHWLALTISELARIEPQFGQSEPQLALVSASGGEAVARGDGLLVKAADVENGVLTLIFETASGEQRFTIDVAALGASDVADGELADIHEVAAAIAAAFDGDVYAAMTAQGPEEAAVAGLNRIVGTDQDDVIYGTAQDDLIEAGAGADTVFGDAGDDVLYGEDGADTLYGEAGNDVLIGGEGADTLFGGEGYDDLAGELGDDMLHGEDGDDNLAGGAGDDDLFGGAGDDNLAGGDGNDELAGGAGDDDIDGGDGDDVILADADAPPAAPIAAAVRAVFDAAENVDADAPPAVDVSMNALESALDGIETQLEEVDAIEVVVVADDGKTRVVASTKDDGDDVIDAGSGNDIVRAGGGQDVVRSGAGGDFVDAGAGDDSVDAGAGADIVLSGSGDDLVLLAAGDDVVDSGAGDDLVYAGDGEDIVFLGAGDDAASGGAGDDILIGDAGNDFVVGDDGDDVFVARKDDGDDFYDGGDGDDAYDASAATEGVRIDLSAQVAVGDDIGADRLESIEDAYGGDGDDVIVASTASNVLSGGAGDDVFVFLEVDSSGKGSREDRILDFEAGDRIDFSMFDGSPDEDGIQKLTFSYNDAQWSSDDVEFVFDDVDGKAAMIIEFEHDGDDDDYDFDDIYVIIVFGAEELGPNSIIS